MTLLADLVDASARVGETSSRTQKIAILAELLRKLESDEIAIATGFLSGLPRQGRVGVGYSTIYGVTRALAGEPLLTIADLDAAITVVQNATGPGSAARRRQLLDDLFASATDAEADFVRRLFTGEL